MRDRVWFLDVTSGKRPFGAYAAGERPCAGCWQDL